MQPYIVACHYTCGSCNGSSSRECFNECSSETRGEKGVPILGACVCKEGYEDLGVKECRGKPKVTPAKSKRK